jgi:hypothetical protein
MTKLSEEELAYLDKMDDVLPTSRAYVRRALAEIREHRAAAQRHVAFANMVDAARESDLILTHEFWPDIEIARRGVMERPAPSLTPEEVEALRDAGKLLREDQGHEPLTNRKRIQRYADCINALDRALAALGNGGGR